MLNAGQIWDRYRQDILRSIEDTPECGLGMSPYLEISHDLADCFDLEIESEDRAIFVKEMAALLEESDSIQKQAYETTEGVSEQTYYLVRS